MTTKERDETSKQAVPSKQKCYGQHASLILHEDISYRKPIRPQSGKIPNHVLRLHVVTHTTRIQEGGKEKERHNKKERPTSVNWKEEHHQVDVKITRASRGQPLQTKLGIKKKRIARVVQCMKVVLTFCTASNKIE